MNEENIARQMQFVKICSNDQNYTK